MRPRHGKIARLPHHLREQLNRRLYDGETAGPILDWLNIQPETQAILAAAFGGVPISEQNLSEWRQGGYFEWFAEKSLFDCSVELVAQGAHYASTGLTTEHFIQVIRAHYAAALTDWDGMPESGRGIQIRVLEAALRGILTLRRSEQRERRLALDEARLAFAREKTRASSPSASTRSGLESSAESNSPAPSKASSAPWPPPELIEALSRQKPKPAAIPPPSHPDKTDAAIAITPSLNSPPFKTPAPATHETNPKEPTSRSAVRTIDESGFPEPAHELPINHLRPSGQPAGEPLQPQFST